MQNQIGFAILRQYLETLGTQTLPPSAAAAEPVENDNHWTITTWLLGSPIYSSKELLGGAGAPKFSEIRQHLNQRKPIEPAAMPHADAPAAAAPTAA